MVTALPAQLTCACPSIDLALRRHVVREREGGGTGQCPGEDDDCMMREIARETRERDVALALSLSVPHAIGWVCSGVCDGRDGSLVVR